MIDQFVTLLDDQLLLDNQPKIYCKKPELISVGAECWTFLWGGHWALCLASGTGTPEVFCWHFVNWNLWRFQLLSQLKCKTLCLSATHTHWNKVLCESQEVSLLWPPSRNVNSSVDVKGTLCWKSSTWQNTECDQVVISSKGPLSMAHVSQSWRAVLFSFALW